MVRASYDSSSKKDEDIGLEVNTLSESEIIGNSFIFLLAGHETTANSIHFSMVYLAFDPSTQRKLQADIDRILGGRDIEELDYHKGISLTCIHPREIK